MLQKNNKIYLNLEEQVLKNKTDIENMTSVSGLLGIKVVNTIQDESQLPERGTEEFEALEYGDAIILVEDAESGQYLFYVKTRANLEEPYDHFFALRLQGIAGPIGPRGMQGPEGQRGNLWFTTRPNLEDCIVGDKYLNYNGLVEEVVELNGQKRWTIGSVADLRGPVGATGPAGEPGPQGERGTNGQKGEKGDPGGFIDIKGRLNATSQLPVPPEKGTDAYFVGQLDPIASNPLYVWTTDNGWINIGILNVATYVTVGGEFVGQFDADTKLDKVTGTSPNDKVYIKQANGYQNVLDVVSERPQANSVAKRDFNGNVKTGRSYDQFDAVTRVELLESTQGQNLVYYVSDERVNMWNDELFKSTYGSYPIKLTFRKYRDEMWEIYKNDDEARSYLKDIDTIYSEGLDITGLLTEFYVEFMFEGGLMRYENSIEYNEMPGEGELKYLAMNEDGNYVLTDAPEGGGGGGEIPENMVTTDTDQAITAQKTFRNLVIFQQEFDPEEAEYEPPFVTISESAISVDETSAYGRSVNIYSDSIAIQHSNSDDIAFVNVWPDPEGEGNLSAQLKLPSESGTLARLEDISEGGVEFTPVYQNFIHDWLITLGNQTEVGYEFVEDMRKPNKYITCSVRANYSSGAEEFRCVFTFYGTFSQGYSFDGDARLVYKAAHPILENPQTENERWNYKNLYLYSPDGYHIIIVEDDPTQKYEIWTFTDADGNQVEKKVVVM